MSFRSGPIVRCVVYDLDNYSQRCVQLHKPTVFDLDIALQNENNRTIFVKRRDRIFVIQSNRDVEEIGGYTGEEMVCIASSKSVNLDGVLPLARYQLHRSEIPARIDTYADCVISSNDILTKGKLIEHGLRKHGFIRVMLTDSEYKLVNSVFDEMEKFTEYDTSFKEKFSYRSIGSDQTQPQFGYRETELNKQYFVCRKLSDQLKKVGLQYPSEPFESTAIRYIEMMGEITKYILVALLYELGCDRYYTRSVIDGTLQPAKSLNTLGFTSMTELFRYDCTGYDDDQYNTRIPCGDHQDVSLFTIIPAARGTGGLEIFDWEREWLCVEHQTQIFKKECIVFPGELLQRLTAGQISATPHRVVIQTGKNVPDRYSAPFELLLDPEHRIDCVAMFPRTTIPSIHRTVETSQDYISRISQKLVSVNK